MTSEDIIVANPGLIFRHQAMGDGPGLIGVGRDGVEFWFMWQGEHHVSATGPLTEENIAAARHNLHSAQPGREFTTVGDDEHAAILRGLGAAVCRDANGHARIQREEAA